MISFSCLPNFLTFWCLFPNNIFGCLLHFFKWNTIVEFMIVNLAAMAQKQGVPRGIFTISQLNNRFLVVPTFFFSLTQLTVHPEIVFLIKIAFGSTKSITHNCNFREIKGYLHRFHWMESCRIGDSVCGQPCVAKNILILKITRKRSLPG